MVDDSILVFPDGVEPTSPGETLVLTSGGPPGQPGPPGPPGPSSNTYTEWSFAVPDAVWTINHNLNTYGLVVETFDSNGQRIIGAESFPTPNTILVEWYYPMSGTARVFN